MFVNLEEQETVINFSRTEDKAMLYTSDRTWMTKMDKLVKSNPKMFKVVEENEISKRYEFPKSLLTVRKGHVNLTEEQRKARSEMMKKRAAKLA